MSASVHSWNYWTDRVTTHDWTPEIELFGMLFGRCCSKIRKTSPEQHTEYQFPDINSESSPGKFVLFIKSCGTMAARN